MADLLKRAIQLEDSIKKQAKTAEIFRKVIAQNKTKRDILMQPVGGQSSSNEITNGEISPLGRT